MNYAYVRVSSMSQNIGRQMEEIRKIEITEKNIYIDRQSGKDFNRLNYQKLIKKLKQGDVLFIKSIDRLGRNYEMIIEEWTRITKKIKADIVVFDMPLLDTRVTPQNLIGKFISDIVLQLLSFVAENEREFIRQRQLEGIKLAKEKGVKFGRPLKPLPPHFQELVQQCKMNVISKRDAAKTLGIPISTFYYWYNNFQK